VTLSPKVLRKTTLNLNVLLSSLFSVVDAMKENPMSLIRVAHNTVRANDSRNQRWRKYIVEKALSTNVFADEGSTNE